MWVQVVDHAGGPATGIDVLVDGVNKPTDPEGLITCDPVEAGPHTVELQDRLADRWAATHKPPASRTKQADVRPGQIVFVKFQLAKKEPRIEVQAEHDFGPVAEFSPAVTVAIKNVGDADLVLGAITFPAHFVADASNTVQAGHTIPPGQTAELKVQFRPQAFGAQTGNLEIGSNAVGTATATVAMRGERLVPKIEVQPGHDFGQVIGFSPAVTIAITNSGRADLVLGAISFPAHFVADASNAVQAGARIAPGASAELKVQFRPQAIGAQAGNLEIGSNDPATATAVVALHGEQVVPRFEVFRGTTALAVVPFATTDVAAKLDAALPDAQQRQAAAVRPTNLDADFDFPAKTAYGTNAKADADPSVFRLRLAGMPRNFQGKVEVLLKVKTAAGTAIPGCTGFKFKDLAAHPAGMKVEFEQNGTEWESPYLRVATTVTALSKDATHAIVHSPAPTGSRDPADGVQFGRRLEMSCKIEEKDFAHTVTLGGNPWARVPVQFQAVGVDPPKTAPVDKLAELNQFWAGHGIEFVPKDPNNPMLRVPVPDRRLIVIGEHTGAAVVADHAFGIDIEVAATTAAGSEQGTIHVDVPANSDPTATAALVRQAIAAWAPAGAVAGLKIDADVFVFRAPRLLLGADPTGQALRLQAIGACGPTDITIKHASGPAVTKLEITRLTVSRQQPGPVVAQPLPVVPDTSVDIYCPPLDKPFHDPNTNPASAAQRGWVRALGPPAGDYVSVLISKDRAERGVAALCEAGLCALHDADEATMKGRFDPILRDLSSSSSPISILNFDRWSEPCARFVIFLFDGNFTLNSNDLQHECGHTFADCNHTPRDPAWFYECELMHPSGPAKGAANQMTRHKIQVDTTVDNGGWQSLSVNLDHGYAGAARARIDRLAPGWKIAAAGPGYPWP